MKIIDGGLATELVRHGQGFIDTDPLWSARLLMTDPSAIRDAHSGFLEAGANVIITASYQASVEGFVKHAGVTKDKAEQLIRESVTVAKEAREKFMSEKQIKADDRPLVAGSVGPYGACLHDGSEYTGSYVDSMTKEELINWHRTRVKLLVESDVDLLAVESLPAKKEAEAIIDLLKEFPSARAWVCFTCKDHHHTSHGEPFQEAVLATLSSDQIFGVGCNCTAPNLVESLLNDIKGVIGIKSIVVYPNSGEIWTNEKKWQSNDEMRRIHTYVPEWLRLGANWVGGCCRTTPDDIHQIKTIVSSYQQQTLHIS